MFNANRSSPQQQLYNLIWNLAVEEWQMNVAASEKDCSMCWLEFYKLFSNQRLTILADQFILIWNCVKYFWSNFHLTFLQIKPLRIKMWVEKIRIHSFPTFMAFQQMLVWKHRKPVTISYRFGLLCKYSFWTNHLFMAVDFVQCLLESFQQNAVKVIQGSVIFSQLCQDHTWMFPQKVGSTWWRINSEPVCRVEYCWCFNISSLYPTINDLTVR